MSAGGKGGKPPGIAEIPDLDVPRSSRAPASNPSGAPPRTSGAPGPGGAPGSSGAPPRTSAAPPVTPDFGMELERGGGLVPSGGNAYHAGREVAINVADDGDFDMELERGGALVSTPPAMSSSSARPPPSRPSGASGLDVGYRRLDPKAAKTGPVGPSVGERVGAWAITVLGSFGAVAALVKLVHRSGGRSVLALLPHAFDATSATQSGAVALGALAIAIGLGFYGVKSTPRSYASIAAAALLLVASLAMVTVTLVATDENPGHADGALLIPYLIPLALVALGAGIAGRSLSLFLAGGASRAAAVATALIGGALAFWGVELSALAARLPF